MQCSVCCCVRRTSRCPRFIFAFLLVQTESTSNFLTLTISVILGSFPGRIVQELRHTLISRTLPNLRRRLFSSLLFAGVLTASIQTWIYGSAGGTAPLLPIFSSVLLWYSVGLVLGMNPVLVTMLRDIRRYVVFVFSSGSCCSPRCLRLIASSTIALFNPFGAASWHSLARRSACIVFFTQSLPEKSRLDPTCTGRG